MSAIGSSGGYHVTIDLPQLLETRLLLQAGSGGGRGEIMASEELFG